MSTSAYQLVEQMIDEAESAVEDSAEYALDAEAYAKGTRNGTAVSSDDPAYHNNSKYYSEVSADNATLASQNAEAWAVGTRGGQQIPSTDPAYNNHARYWAGQAEQFAQGGLIYKGSIAFANIPVSGMKVGDMYNITDDFTTDNRFQEGAGKLVKAGTNIAWNSNSKWDAMVALGIDTVPTQNSTNLITSGGVWSAIDTAITQVLAASY